MNISNKSVLITGANRGIGRALLDEALRRGAKKVYAGTRDALQHPHERVTPPTLDGSKGRRAQRDAVTESALGGPRRDAPCSRPRPGGHRYEPRLQHTESLD